jgi:dTDP-4-amino-4,6-dideoxygalactose transaminase
MTVRSSIPLSEPDLRGNERTYLERCVADNWVSSAGPFVTKFETGIAALCNRRFAVATASGTTALQLALTAAGGVVGKLVIVPDWTFAATANAVIHAGATPLFVEVARETWTLDPNVLKRAIKEYGGRIAAVVPVHALGHPSDMDAILSACDAVGIPVIEDAAGAIGARYRGRPIGSMGRAAMLSFNGNKTVTAGGGGMIVTDDEALASRARHLSRQARVGADYRHDAVGFNYRMTNLNAAVGIAQLERLDEMVGAKRRIAERYDQAIARRNDLSPMPRATWADHSCWLYSCLAASDDDANALVAHLTNRGIEARVFWRSLSAQAPYRDAPRVLNGVAREISGRVVSLPCSSSLSEAAQARVIEALAEWRGGRLSGTA